MTSSTAPRPDRGGGPPRHGMIVHAYYPIGEPRVKREAEALVAAGREVDVVCLQGPGEPPLERHQGVTVHRLPVSRDKRSLPHQLAAYVRFAARATIRVAQLHRAHPYTTLQAHNLPDFLVFSTLVPRLQGVPVILDLHDLMPEFFEGRFGGRRRALSRLVAWQERVSCAYADHVVTVSDHWRDALVARHVPPDRCSVVANVADDAIFRPVPRRTEPGVFRLLYHGTVTRRYGLDLVVRAVAELADDLPELRFTVLGQGDAMPELVALRRELGLEDRVDLRDEVLPVEALPDVIATADLGVVPYRDDPFTDGLLPTKLMEYGAMGVPCVAARTTAIERAFAGTMVELFPPGDVTALASLIRELHDDPARRRQLAERSRVFNQRWSWPEVGSAYVALVDRLASTPPRGRPRTASSTAGRNPAA